MKRPEYASGDVYGVVELPHQLRFPTQDRGGSPGDITMRQRCTHKMRGGMEGYLYIHTIIIAVKGESGRGMSRERRW